MYQWLKSQSRHLRTTGRRLRRWRRTRKDGHIQVTVLCKQWNWKTNNEKSQTEWNQNTILAIYEWNISKSAENVVRTVVLNTKKRVFHQNPNGAATVVSIQYQKKSTNWNENEPRFKSPHSLSLLSHGLCLWQQRMEMIRNVCWFQDTNYFEITNEYCDDNHQCDHKRIGSSRIIFWLMKFSFQMNFILQSFVWFIMICHISLA